MHTINGPKAPKDPIPKRDSFYIMRRKEVKGGSQPEGPWAQYLYLNNGRLPGFAKIVGNVQDQEMLSYLETAEGFLKITAAIGVTIESSSSKEGESILSEHSEKEAKKNQTIDFVLQMYGKQDAADSGTVLRVPIQPDGMEHVLEMEGVDWTGDDDVPGQIRFEFPRPGQMATVDVRLYLREGFSAPEPEEETSVDLSSQCYQEMVSRSLMQIGSPLRLKKVITKAARGEDVTLAFIGGSITQGAGAIPIHESCYPFLTYQSFCEKFALDLDHVHYVKAGVGGTPSELGMIRYERDVMKEGRKEPDLVVVEFAVNDAGDETNGECYESLIRKIMLAPNAPAVILLFNVFADDWNLQDRLSAIGKAYGLPMVSIKDAVTAQFYQNADERVLSKNQFFYDALHPNNMGHRVIADCLMNLIEEVEKQSAGVNQIEQSEVGIEDKADIRSIPPVYGVEFQNIRLLDRKATLGCAMIDCGSFQEIDKNLQAVEMDRDILPTPQFPFNWMHVRGDEPFRMRITCTALIMVYKDSGDNKTGKAEVCVDGVPVLTADPLEAGWIHCNPVILFRKRERREHLVEIRMVKEDNNTPSEKEFTILGFGVVE